MGSSKNPTDNRTVLVEAYIRALWSWDVEVHSKAAEELGKLGDPRPVPMLIYNLTRRGEEYEDVAAAEALGKLGICGRWNH
jgi:HEAT repeat protein